MKIQPSGWGGERKYNPHQFELVFAPSMYLLYLLNVLGCLFNLF